ncbi:FAD binding domain-containing protein [Streptomyces sp. NPDC048514]|uniref:FAD binding domain-containing protein n=1 Tax=Streptomyces sp. NPDC048514 TaxID=3365564 RepID=UPI0037208912
MRPISYSRATDTATAVAAVSADPTSDFLAGGTTEIDLLRQNVLHPRRLVDINGLPLTGIETTPEGGLRIGALARMSEVAASPTVRERFPLISQALELGASAQLRHMASMGGNLLQRARCSYYRDAVSPCNKRDPGTGCSAVEGFSRGHAVLGTSEHCIATHPSDVAVALMAVDARVHTLGPQGERAYEFDDFFLPPGDSPHREHPMEHGELITAIEVPAMPLARHSLYLKVRDRESYEFALVSVAAAVSVVDGTIADVRVALGGVATKPWRARRVEDFLIGARVNRGNFAQAARVELIEARPTRMNAFKIELAQRAVVRALETLTDGDGDGDGDGGVHGDAHGDGDGSGRSPA